MRPYLILAFILINLNVYCNGLGISGVTKDGNSITFSVNWNNSWRYGDDHYDAVWLFVKHAPNGGPTWLHSSISNAFANVGGYEIISPADKVGIFVQRKNTGDFQGSSSVSVTLTFDNLLGSFQDFKVFGIEMVYIPQGSFYAGDGTSQGRIRRGDNANESVFITSENLLTCGNTAQDILIQFTSYGCSSLPNNYPKGFAPFYIMKYHITQGQYVDFLNCLNRSQQSNRINTDIGGTSITNVYVMCDDVVPVNNNVIKCDPNIGNGKITFYCDRDNDGIGNESDDAMYRSCNYIGGDDIAAYLDWCGLRPMSFLEYEKACRGPLPPIPNEYSWGSILTNVPSSVGSIITLLNNGTSSEKYTNSGFEGGIITGNGVIRVGFNAPASGATRELSNATYYGVIDMGNNPGDFYVAEYYPYSTFEGKSGDGTISTSGDANVPEWPDYANRQSFAMKFSAVSSIGSGVPIPFDRGGGRGVRSL